MTRVVIIHTPFNDRAIYDTAIWIADRADASPTGFLSGWIVLYLLSLEAVLAEDPNSITSVAASTMIGVLSPTMLTVDPANRVLNG